MEFRLKCGVCCVISSSVLRGNNDCDRRSILDCRPSERGAIRDRRAKRADDGTDEASHWLAIIWRSRVSTLQRLLAKQRASARMVPPARRRHSPLRS
eukprot:5564548-Prymnesium_polylepis.2